MGLLPRPLEEPVERVLQPEPLPDLGLQARGDVRVGPRHGVHHVAFQYGVVDLGQPGGGALAALSPPPARPGRPQSCCSGRAGLGGLGMLVAEQLARCGFRDFVLVDPDTVDLSNLNRLPGARRCTDDTLRIGAGLRRSGAERPAAMPLPSRPMPVEPALSATIPFGTGKAPARRATIPCGRACGPARKAMLCAATQSALCWKLQAVQRKSAWLRRFSLAVCLQRGHSWLVCLGSTATTRTPLSAALYSSRKRKRA